MEQQPLGWHEVGGGDVAGPRNAGQPRLDGLVDELCEVVLGEPRLGRGVGLAGQFDGCVLGVVWRSWLGERGGRIGRGGHIVGRAAGRAAREGDRCE